MLERRINAGVLMLVLTAFSATVVEAQPQNLLRNPNAGSDGARWRAAGDATVERGDSYGPHFVVRNGGWFSQDVALPEGSAGKYALLIGRVSSERVNADGAITGLPYLYGYMLADAKGSTINAYLQGQQMLAQAKARDEWVVAWGVFEVPDGTVAIKYFLNQAERSGVPQNGSAARFDDLGLYLFDTAEEAKLFVDLYSESIRLG